MEHLPSLSVVCPSSPFSSSGMLSEQSTGDLFSAATALQDREGAPCSAQLILQTVFPDGDGTAAAPVRS